MRDTSPQTVKPTKKFKIKNQTILHEENTMGKGDRNPSH